MKNIEITYEILYVENGTLQVGETALVLQVCEKQASLLLSCEEGLTVKNLGTYSELEDLLYCMENLKGRTYVKNSACGFRVTDKPHDI